MLVSGKSPRLPSVPPRLVPLRYVTPRLYPTSDYQPPTPDTKNNHVEIILMQYGSKI